MKKHKYLPVILTLALLIFSACQKEVESNIVKLEPTVKKELTLGKVKEIIPLETSDESLLDFVTKTYIDKENNRVFVNADMNVYLFDTNGKFIKKLKKGKGPGEVNHIVSFTVDREIKRLYAIDVASYIHIFDYDVNFIESQKVNEFSSLDLHPLDKDNLFLFCSYVGRSQKHFVGIYNLKEKKVVQRLVPGSESPYSIFCTGNASNFYEIEDRLFFTSSNIFGVFEFQADTFRRNITYDLGDKAVPESFYASYVERRKRSKFKNDAMKKDLIPFLKESFYFNDHYIAVLYDENSTCYAINAKNRDKVYFKEQLSDYFNLPRVNSLIRACAVQGDFLTFACSPLDFFEEDATEERKTIEIAGQKIEIKYDMNPFLIVVE